MTSNSKDIVKACEDLVKFFEKFGVTVKDLEANMENFCKRLSYIGTGVRYRTEGGGIIVRLFTTKDSIFDLSSMEERGLIGAASRHIGERIGALAEVHLGGKLTLRGRIVAIEKIKEDESKYSFFTLQLEPYGTEEAQQEVQGIHPNPGEVVNIDN